MADAKRARLSHDKKGRFRSSKDLKVLRFAAKSRSRHHCKRIAEELGIPNCFVCRRDRENIVPLDRQVLEAILPEVQKKPPHVDVDYANGALLAWKQLIERMLMRDLTLNRLYLYSLDAATMRVQDENGALEIEQFSDVGEVTSRERG